HTRLQGDWSSDVCSSDLAPVAERQVVFVGPALVAMAADLNPGLRIRISGHCDERGSDEYNLALGNRRATAAKQYVVSHGIDAGRIETVSYGEERPLASGHDEEAWAQNRRDEFEILSGGENLKQP